MGEIELFFIMKVLSFFLSLTYGAKKCPENIIKWIDVYPFQAPKPIQVDQLGSVSCTDGINEGSTCTIDCTAAGIEVSWKGHDSASCVCSKSKKDKSKKKNKKKREKSGLRRKAKKADKQTADGYEEHQNELAANSCKWV